MFDERGSNVSESLVLASDTAFIREGDLRPYLRSAAGCKPGDWLLSRKHGRACSLVVSEELALLLREFRRPITLGHAVEAYCAIRGLDVQSVANRVDGPIRRMKSLGYLREPHGCSDSQEPSCSGLAPKGDWHDPVLIQDLDGAQVFRVEWQRRASVLKVGRERSAHAETPSEIQREAEVLKQLPTGKFPRFLSAGVVDGRHYLLATWFEGLDALAFANRLRWANSDYLLQVCADILDCYRILESAGWLHRDVHPRNVIVHKGSEPRLIDFGHAHRAMQSCAGVRAGIAYFFDPPYAEALLNRTALPSYDSASEQYALAAMLRLLITGDHYLDFDLERQQMLRQIVEDAPVPFCARRGACCPAIEEVLDRALRKAPDMRFPTIAAFADCFRAGLPQRPSAKVFPRKVSAADFVHGPVSQLAWEAPRPELRTIADAAVHDGAAGLAYAQYRLAILKQDPLLLASSEVWISRARKIVLSAKERCNGVEPATFPGSLHHGPPGIHCVSALIAMAQGNAGAAITLTREFLQTVPDGAANRDMTHGMAGSLVGCAVLMERLRPVAPEEILTALKRKGDTLARAVWTESEMKSHGSSGEFGIAHGESGRLYARLRWGQASRAELSEPVKARVAALFCGPQREVQGPRSPDAKGRATFVKSSWCNGSAGHVQLLLLAAATTGDAQFGAEAAVIAKAVWRDRTRSACLCCGLAGRAFAMLSMARATGDAVWIDRAAVLVLRSEASAETLGPGLYKGRAGVELARIELTAPEYARMPLFE
jgi:eukaryotic-like serine/threonine-protein kinase